MLVRSSLWGVASSGRRRIDCFQVTATVNSSSQTLEVTNYVNTPRPRPDRESSVIFIPRVSNVWAQASAKTLLLTGKKVQLDHEFLGVQDQ